MSATGLDVFDTTLQKTHRWLNELMQIMEWDDKDHAYLALRATLHALRDRLTVDEVAQFAAQLPMLVRGFFYEGWNPATKPARVRHKAQFLEEVARPFRAQVPIDPEPIVRGVFTLLSRRISEGEIADIRQVLPHELRELWEPRVAGSNA
jgi:uncharacterized protein (DUF2267 family)